MDDILLSASADPKSYPLWILFNVPLLRQTGDFRKALPIHKATDGDRFAAVFTDKDLAQRFLDEDPGRQQGSELMPVENLERLRAVLQLYLEIGVNYVGTDFSTAQFGAGIRRGQLRGLEAFLTERD